MTESRRERQQAILALINRRPLSTQAELARALHEAGYDVVQTTVSRDIAELGLVKVRGEDGRLTYALPGGPERERLRNLAAAFDRWALTCESNGVLLVATTPSGFANALAQAIDEARHPEILGTIAGDNTILVVPREGVDASRLRDELRDHILEGVA